VVLSWILVAAVRLTAAAATPEQQETELRDAIRAVDDLDDTQARTLLGDLLASNPPDRIAAQAYLYLGIMDFNAVDRIHARAELRRALELDSTIDVPPTLSPKLLLTFEEIRRDLARKFRQEDAAGAAVPRSALEATPAATVVVEAPTPRRHVWPWVLGAAAVVAAGGSVWGWVEVSDFEGLKGTSAVTVAQAQSAHDAAVVGEGVGIACAIAAVGLVAGTIATW
jgi:hypothetical protein